jgi:salicylate hydroxylase
VFSTLFSVIHRVDYHRILYDEAIRLDAVLRLGAEVTRISVEEPTALLADGTMIRADVIIGADGNQKSFSVMTVNI